MPIRTIATLAVAILFGLIAVVLVRNYLTAPHQGGPTQVAVGTMPVVVAAAKVPRGAALEPNLLKIVNFPVNAVPPGAYSSLSQLNPGKDGQHLALRALEANEAILPTKITGPTSRLSLSSILGSGMRAVSLRANDVSGVGGFVLPGDRVDVLLTRNIEGGAQTNNVTQVVAENVRVLGVDQSDDDEASKPVISRSVTLETTPDQAQAISLGQAVGTVSLTLRHAADDTVQARRATQVADLGFAPRFVAPQAAATQAAPAKPASVVSPEQAMRLRLRPGETEVRVTRGVDTSGYAVSLR